MIANIKKYANTAINDKLIYAILFLFSFVIMFFNTKMSPLYPFNDWSDINLYFTIGKGIFNGITPYSEAFDHKGPLIFLIYGIGYLISNTSFLGMFVILSLVWFSTSIFAYRIGCFFLNKGYAFLVALATPILSLSHTMEGGSAEEFILLAMIPSLYLLIKQFKEKELVHNPLSMLTHGILVCVVFLIKPNLVVFWIAPLAVIFVDLILKKSYKFLFKNLLALIAGTMIILVPVCLYFAINGALGEAFDIYITLNRAYAQIPEWSESIRLFIVRFYQRLRFDTIDFSIIVLGAFYFPFRFIKNKKGAWSITLSFLLLYAVIFISPVYIHYYSVPYYAFVILGLVVIFDYLSRFVKIDFKAHLVLFFTLMALTLGIPYKNYFDYDNDILMRRVEDKSLINQFGKHIERVKNPRFLNLSLDNSTALFTKYDIMPTVKYFVSPNLSYEQYPQMRDEQTKYIEKKLIDFIQISASSFNYEYFNELPILHRNYELIDTYSTDGVYGTTHYLYKRRK